MAFTSEFDDLGALSDAEVLERSRTNPDLFRVLVRRYEAPFLRRAQRILRSPEDAEEVVQDAFTRIYLYADRYQPMEGASFSSWAYAVLNRVAYTKYQTNKKAYAARAELDPEVYEALPDEGAVFLEDLSIRSEVLAALSKLPEAAARILTLQFIQGKNQEEIAREEGISLSAVKTRIHRAKKLFKKIHDTQRYE